MSDKSSESINTTLTSLMSSSPQEFYNWFSFNVKIFLFLFFLIIVVYLISPIPSDYDTIYKNIMRHGHHGHRDYHGHHGHHIHHQNCGCNLRSHNPKEIISNIFSHIDLDNIKIIPLHHDVPHTLSHALPAHVVHPQVVSPHAVPAQVVPHQVVPVPQAVPKSIVPPQAVPAQVVPPKSVVSAPVVPPQPLPKNVVQSTKNIEKFSNEEMMSYSYEKTSEYQSIPLIAPFDENKNPINLFFGQAHRYIYKKDSKMNYRLEIYCNLSVLNGNVFDMDKTNVIQSYKVYLIDSKKNEKNYLDELKKDGDGMYKLKFNSISINKEASDFIRFDKIEIVYKENSKETVLLTGKFN